MRRDTRRKAESCRKRAEKVINAEKRAPLLKLPQTRKGFEIKKRQKRRKQHTKKEDKVVEDVLDRM